MTMTWKVFALVGLACLGGCGTDLYGPTYDPYESAYEDPYLTELRALRYEAERERWRDEQRRRDDKEQRREDEIRRAKLRDIEELRRSGERIDARAAARAACFKAFDRERAANAALWSAYHQSGKKGPQPPMGPISSGC